MSASLRFRPPGMLEPIENISPLRRPLRYGFIRPLCCKSLICGE